jgi:hypothetical protein
LSLAYLQFHLSAVDNGRRVVFFARATVFLTCAAEMDIFEISIIFGVLL